MNPRPASLTTTFALMSLSLSVTAAPKLPGVGDAMQRMIYEQEIAGAVTIVADRDSILHLETTGHADVAADKPMQPDTVFWIASMTKPVTAVALLMLQEEGRLHVDDPVATYLPAYAELRTPSGQPANLTIRQILLHTSGLGEASREQMAAARTLADLIPAYLAAPMEFEPGAQWKYCQSGINTAAHIVELVGGQPFEVFLEQRLFAPLGMKDTGFYPNAEQAARMTQAYAKNRETGALELSERRFDPATRDRPPLGNGGLFSTAPDYVRFGQMLLRGGEFDGKRYLKAESIALMTEDRTADLEAGFVPGSAWGLVTCLVREPQGVTAALSPGTYGHGGAHGTQAWIDPVKGLVHIMMVQRSNFPNSDGSSVREAFHNAVAKGLDERKAN